MKALVQDRYGSAAELEFRDIDQPTPGPGQVLVRVVAAGMDRGAWHFMTGQLDRCRRSRRRVATSALPPSDHPVWDPATHLAVAVPFMCANLRLVTAHLHASGKRISPLDALAVCHIGGCSRVTGSATGIPRPGETGCDIGCVQQITAYLAAIHH